MMRYNKGGGRGGEDRRVVVAAVGVKTMTMVI